MRCIAMISLKSFIYWLVMLDSFHNQVGTSLSMFHILSIKCMFSTSSVCESIVSF